MNQDWDWPHQDWTLSQVTVEGGVWSHGLPGQPLWSLRALSPYLEVAGVGPEADPAHVLQEYVQGVPCPACYLQCCLPIPLQSSLVLLKPQGQCCWPMFGSHHPQHCQQAHSILLPAPPEPGLLSAPKKGGKSGPRSQPTKAQYGFWHPGCPQDVAWHSPTASRSHSPLEHSPRTGVLP